MNKRWRNIGLGALLVLAIVVIAPAFFGGGGGSQPQVNTIRYSEFVEAVKDDQISRVLISPDSIRSSLGVKKVRPPALPRGMIEIF